MTFKKLSFLIIIILFSCNSNKKISKSDIGIKSENKNKNNPILINKKKYNIQTVLLHQKDNQRSKPIINLNSNDILELSFDDLNDKISQLFYSIEHYSFDWEKSDLLISEFVRGFSQNEVIDYEYSFNTLKKYIHYSVLFPSKNFNPIISGNYKIHVFDNYGDTIISKKFMVIEKKINIESRVKRATLANDRKTKHEIDFTIKHPNLIVNDPFTDIEVVIQQNNNLNVLKDLKPIYVKNNELIYDYNDENTFFGLNEYRNFSTESIRYFSEKVKNITIDSNNITVTLFEDLKKSFNNYSIEPDINGDFIIKSQKAWNSSNEAEYLKVIFSLKNELLENQDIYIVGKLNDSRLNKKFKLEYNYEKKKYSKSILLKQGYYNYHYQTHDTLKNIYSINDFEGSYYQTRNDYYIYVYHKEIGERYYKLIGLTKTSSKELF
tara:strand:+ start:374 stop:1681 length:1308 start_codon:yes stop_codon:yes gene_type:complete